MTLFASITHLIGRHPELVRQEEFRSWLARYGGDIWHETHPTADDLISVIVQSLDHLHLFAALVRREKSFLTNGQMPEIIRTAKLDLFDSKFSAKHALFALIETNGLQDNQVQAIRPVVNFLPPVPEVSWEIEVVNDRHIESYGVDIELQVHLLAERELDFLNEFPEINMTMDLLVPANDWLEENDLHHPSSMFQEAEAWTHGMPTAMERAKRIWEQVGETYSYDETITNIKIFTFADILVRFQLGRLGVCDEFAVVQVSYLRALRIPSVIKFLNFEFGGRRTAHACVEFLNDDGRWVHMDPLYAAFDQPSVYRKYGAKSVMVMDANFPRDDRSIEPVLGLPDYPRDGKLNPYNDFLLNPTYPGSQRPGYSY
jgi:transglutaminase-like putative cysteine protease